MKNRAYRITGYPPLYRSRRVIPTILAGLWISTAVAAQWTAEGPGPITGGQVEGITDGEVVGAINAVAAHPSSAGTLYAGAVNGGIWKTTNATAANPTWTQQTDAQDSLSIGALEFDPTDGTNQTLLAGIGRFSSFDRLGGRRAGLLRTTNGGTDWTVLDGSGMAGRNIIGVAARGNVLVAAVDVADAFICPNIGIFRSIDTGDTWAQITSGIPRGSVDALASDPGDTDILYASIVFASACDGGGAANGIYKSSNRGATWSKVSTAAMDALLEDYSGTHVEIAVGLSDNVFVAIVPASTGQLGGVFRSGNGGTSWTAMDLPTTFEDTASVGIHPGRQGGTHLSIAADPTDADIVYVGGDRQPLSFNDTFNFPNSIGAVDFSGRLFRGDAGLAPGSQWTTLTHSGTQGNSSPHADSRDMAFDAAGNLIEVDDGGIYKRTLPRSAAGDWDTLNGDIQTTELHDLAYDANSDILIGGAQDTGTPEQAAPGGTTWSEVSSADGGDVAVDDISTPGLSIRYSSNQNLGGFRRRTYNAANVLQSQVFPARLVVSGAAFVPQFVTPVAVNQVDGTRLILGGGNSVYESLDQGDTLSEIGVGILTRGFGRNNIAYGAAGNANILYIGGCIGSCSSDNNDGVFVRTTGGGPLNLSLASSSVRSVAVDPDAAARAFAIETSTVHRTINTGGLWTDITGNLNSFSPGTLRSIAYIDRAVGPDDIVVGADRGVFLTEADGAGNWIHLASDLPDVPVFDLDYDSATNTLFAGTLGRGAFSLQPAEKVDAIFFDAFESGDITRWSTSVP